MRNALLFAFAGAVLGGCTSVGSPFSREPAPVEERDRYEAERTGQERLSQVLNDPSAGPEDIQPVFESHAATLLKNSPHTKDQFNYRAFENMPEGPKRTAMLEDSLLSGLARDVENEKSVCRIQREFKKGNRQNIAARRAMWQMASRATQLYDLSVKLRCRY